MEPIRTVVALPGSRDPKDFTLVCDDTGSVATFNNGTEVDALLARI
jgi:hypothetical protein